MLSRKISVMILAAGYGTRLRPITNIIPKPLIPLGKSTVLEQIISNFRINGFNNIFISPELELNFTL